MRIHVNAFGQVWQAADLNPDRITSEMCKLFIFDQHETYKHNNKQNYYSVNQKKDSPLPAHAPLDMRIRTLFGTVFIHASNDPQQKNSEEYEKATHSAVSEAEIKKAAAQVSIEGAWEGHKFIPKSFKVFKLIDVVDRLQVAVIAKQLLAEKASGAVIRRIGALSSLSDVANLFASLDNSSLYSSLENVSLLASLTNTNFLSPSNNDAVIAPSEDKNLLIGEIKLYAGSAAPRASWLPCDGSIVFRSTYPRLFEVIGTKYGSGNNLTTFKLPDLRGRVPMGSDPRQVRVSGATDVGAEGGEASHTLSVEQLPSHAHDRGSLRNTFDGQHTHGVFDPGHSHVSRTSHLAMSSSVSNDYGQYNQQALGLRQSQTVPMATTLTQISIQPNGTHSHQLMGQTSVVGDNRPFSILPPYQTFTYIIYAGWKPDYLPLSHQVPIIDQQCSLSILFLCVSQK